MVILAYNGLPRINLNTSFSNEVNNNMNTKKWSPNIWVTILLTLFLQNFVMLYLGRAKLALGYFLLFIAIMLLDIRSDGINYLALILVVLFSIHTLFLFKNFKAITRPWYSRWYGLASIYAIVFLIFMGFRAFIYEPFHFPSASMSPTIKAGQFLITQKWGYGNYATFNVSLLKTDNSQKVQRGDILVFEYPQERSITYAKRIIGLPNDRIDYQNKTLKINGKEVKTHFISTSEDEQYKIMQEDLPNGVSHQIKLHNSLSEVPPYHLVVPDKCYFSMGDNRDNSNDSRYWGCVPEDALIGKVVRIF